MADGTKCASERAKREDQFRDIERSQADALQLIAASKREIERAKNLLRGSHVVQDQHERMTATMPTNTSLR